MNGWSRRLAAALCLCLALALGVARAEQSDGKARDITAKCAFKVSEGERGKLSDGNVRTRWSYKKLNAYVGVKLPKGTEAGWLRIEWMFDPVGFALIEYDADMNELRTRDQGDTFPNIYTVFELLPETRFIQLRMTALDQDICSVRVYSRGELPPDVQVWNPPVVKADLMVVSAHQDDEIVFMGGTIPYYATALGKPTVVVYMANCTRYRRNEALNSLWVMGVRDYPEFINLKDDKPGSVEAAAKLWGGKDNVLSLLVQRIRRFKPEVIVTHDLDGEYGHNQHKLTARAMKYAIDAAADESRYPESAAVYGAWQVKKLYHHLYKENALMMDWETPLDSLGGLSPLKVAQRGMQEQASQLKYYAVKSHGTYDNAKFGLYFSTVGEDVAKDDFLENIDPDASEKYLAEHPEAIEIARATAVPTPEPTPTPTPEPTAAPTPMPAPTGAPEAETGAQAAMAPSGGQASATPQPTSPPRTESERGGSGPALALAAAGIAALGAGGWFGYRAWRQSRAYRRRRGRSRR